MAIRSRIDFFVATLFLSLAVIIGCVPPPKAEEKKENDGGGGILNKTTKEVGEWNPNGGQKIKETEEANMVNHIRVGAGFAIHEIARMKVEKSLQLFQAEHGRFPKSHDEFMKKVFDVYVLELPAPLTSCEYQYDVENHRLVVVEKKKEE